jgi:hypothetical protein
VTVLIEKGLSRKDRQSAQAGLLAMQSPHGNNPPDETRDSSFYDGTYEYLRSLGLKELESSRIDRGY